MNRLSRTRRVPRPLCISGETLDRRWYYLGLGLIIASIALHLPLLIVSGILVLLVAGLTDLWAQQCFHGLLYRRLLSEERVTFGEEITLAITVENAKLLPLPWLEVKDIVPRALPIEGKVLRGTGLHGDMATLDCLLSARWYERITRRYTVHCTQRGVHTFGPTVLYSGDVFGFTNRELAVSNQQYLLVYPLVVPLSSFGIPARHPFGDRRAPRRLLEDPSRVIGVRDYAYGDSIRHVHWKATARTMQLQSKVYEATTTYTLMLFLNIVSQLDTYYGIHPELQELAICATASVATWAIEQGYAVGLHTNTITHIPDEKQERSSNPVKEQTDTLALRLAAQLKRRRIHLPATSNPQQLTRILDVLARIQNYFGTNIEDVILAERMRLPAGATVVVITSAISEQLVDTLARIRQGSHAVAILFVGDTPLPHKLAGIPIYHLGGEGTWENLVAPFGVSPQRAGYVKESVSGFSL